MQRGQVWRDGPVCVPSGGAAGMVITSLQFPPTVSADTGPRCLQGTQTTFSRRHSFSAASPLRSPSTQAQRVRLTAWEAVFLQTPLCRILLLPADFQIFSRQDFLYIVLNSPCKIFLQVSFPLLLCSFNLL